MHPIFAFILSVVCAAAPAFAHSRFRIYSESLTSHNQTQNVLTESRIRFHPLRDEHWQPFVGFYKNPFNFGPTLGLLYVFGPGRRFQLLAEQRIVYSERERAVGESRFGLIFGDWREFEHSFFLDSYGEVILIPRIDGTPVTTLWTRAGWRAKFSEQLYLDPFFQLWTRASVSRDLGEPGTEWRPGVRISWLPMRNFVLGLSAYRRLTFAPVRDKQWEALFVIQGEF